MLHVSTTEKMWGLRPEGSQVPVWRWPGPSPLTQSPACTACNETWYVLLDTTEWLNNSVLCVVFRDGEHQFQPPLVTSVHAWWWQDSKLVACCLEIFKPLWADAKKEPETCIHSAGSPRQPKKQIDTGAIYYPMATCAQVVFCVFVRHFSPFRVSTRFYFTNLRILEECKEETEWKQVSGSFLAKKKKKSTFSVLSCCLTDHPHLVVCSTNPVGQKFGQGLKRTAWLFTWYQLHSAELGWKFQSELRTVVQLLSYIRLLVTPWTAACQASLPFTISQFAQTH